MISIVCPFYNEKDSIQELVSRLHKAAGELQEPWEVLLVDDGSTDGGAESLSSETLAKGFRILTLAQNRGLTTALYAGLQAAKGDVIATLDSDLQNPPEEIPRLIEILKKEKMDMVAGIRGQRQDGWLKRTSSLVARYIRQTVIRDTIQDTGCSLRVFKRSVLEAFYPYRGMHRFFAPVAQVLGFKILQVPVQHEMRKFGKSKYGLLNRLLGPLWDLIAVRWVLTNKIQYQIKE